jgi:hypothetical protein
VAMVISMVNKSVTCCSSQNRAMLCYPLYYPRFSE